MSPSLPDLVNRGGRLVLRAAAQAVPPLGVFGLSWPAAGGLMLYWLESVLALAGTLLLLVLFARRAQRNPEREGDRSAVASGGLRPRDVLIFQGGAFGIFGLFFGGYLTILVLNGYIVGADLLPALDGVAALAGIAGLVLLLDLLRFRRLTTEDMQRRVGAGNRRFAVFWLVGFFGVIAAAVTNKPLLVFAVFAVVKALFEIGGMIDRRPATL